MKKLLHIIFLLLPAYIAAQNYVVENLGIKEGLSNNHVVSIRQDKRGFMWFATEEGLNMFDGIKFRSFYKEEGKSIVLSGNELNDLLDDPKDSILWIATQRAGLNAYNYKKSTLTIYKNDPTNPHSLITNDITKITPSSEDNIWICTYWKGIDLFNKKTGHFTHYNQSTIPELPSNSIWTALDGKDGNLYIGHVNHGFSILNIKNHRVINMHHIPNNPQSLPDNEVTCIYKDMLNNIWVGTAKGLALYNPIKHEFKQINDNKNSLSHKVFSILQTKDNKLWIAMELGGIAIIDMSQHLFNGSGQIEFTLLKDGYDDYSLSGNSIRSMFQDSFGNMWIGGWGNGIDFISPKRPIFNSYKYSPYFYYNSINNKTASSLCFDKNGKLWIGTDGGGINLFQNGKRIKVFKTSNSGSTENAIQASLCDSKGGLWFGLFSGGIRYVNAGKETFEHIKLKDNDKFDTDVRSFTEDKSGNIWVGTSEGIYIIDREKRKVITHYNVGNNLVRSIYIAPNNNIWIGFYGDGLSIYSNKMKKIREYYGDNFISNTVNMITADSKNRIWVGTGEGLVRFDNMNSINYKAYKSENGMINAHIFAIAEDMENNIWASSNRGLSCLIKGDGTIYNYDHHDNVPLGSFSRGCVTKDNEGNMYFGSINGVCFFNPENVLKKRKTPHVLINTLEIAGPINSYNSSQKEVSITDESEIELSYKQNCITITFNVLDYSLNSQVEYAYKLEGLSDSWYTVKEDNSVTFRNLPHGKYTFYIKARIRNQEWSDEVSELTLHIAPPIWLTWWAKSIYILAVIAIIFFMIRIYKHQLEVKSLYKIEKNAREQEQELNAERLRFYTNITHELRTPLTLILGPLEDLTHNSSLSTKDSQTINVIYKSAIRLLNLINELLEFRKVETQNRKLCVEKDNIIPLIKEIGNKYRSLNTKKEVDILLNIESENTILYFDHEIIQIILDNLISNALKYTAKGSITIGVRNIDETDNGKVQIWISDTGCGIEKEAIPHIFDRYYQANNSKHVAGTGIGLSLVKELTQLHEGDITIESEQGVGTTFLINLLKDNSYPNALHTENDENIEASAETEAVDADNKVEKPILLIVEDNNDIAEYIASSLSDKFTIHIANNGQEGKTKAFELIPDIIVSDVMMPIMDGNAMCRILKNDVRTSHIPIILLTAKDSIQDKEEGYQVGADSYLTKPFSSSLLKSRIDNLIESRNKLASYYHKSNTYNTDNEVIPIVNVLDTEFINKMNSLIEDNIAVEKIDIAFISDKMCMSSSTLYRKMKALTGLSTNEYVRKRKMKYAWKLLLEGRYNISEIASHIGFNNLFYFRQCFKEEYGMTPTEYLKEMKKPKEHS